MERSGGGVWCDSSGVVSNCVLTGNSANWAGGGAHRGTLSNCMIANNSASYGGGAEWATLNNCTLTANSASQSGGGAYDSTMNGCTLAANTASAGGGTYIGNLKNCTLSRNSASSGGGALRSALNNCILWDNSSTNGPNWSKGTLTNCCTTPLPEAPDGTGNTTNEPGFAGSNDFHLAAGSACIDRGDNAVMPWGTDLDGVARPLDGDSDGTATVDIGAYEFAGSASDTDHDGMNDWAETRARTDPTDGASVLGFMVMSNLPQATAGAIVVRWPGVAGVRYRLERSTNLLAEPPFDFLVRTNIPGTAPINTEIDATATGAGPWFYRVGVE
jgi:parallel beta-helix repeat protein